MFCNNVVKITINYILMLTKSDQKRGKLHALQIRFVCKTEHCTVKSSQVYCFNSRIKTRKPS